MTKMMIKTCVSHDIAVVSFGCGSGGERAILPIKKTRLSTPELLK